MKFEYPINMSEKTLEHKLKDGLKSEGRYCYWTRKSSYNDIYNFLCPPRSIDRILGPFGGYIWIDDACGLKDTRTVADDLDIEVSLIVSVNGKKRGRFKCFGCNGKFTELWFHSEDWEERRNNNG